MAKEQKTITIAVCDRCKREGDTGDATSRNEWGETNLHYKGHTGGRTNQGDAGGCNHEGSKWLCLDCTRHFLDFLGGKQAASVSPGKASEGVKP
jgi:hypothetical protein